MPKTFAREKENQSLEIPKGPQRNTTGWTIKGSGDVYGLEELILLKGGMVVSSSFCT